MRWIGWVGAATSTVAVGTLLQVAACSSGYETEGLGLGGAAGAAGTSGVSGANGNESLGGAGGHGAEAPATACDPDAKDDPDPEFRDENCDGIDGDEKTALFVSPLGSDEDAGTRSAPLATLTRALELARKSGFAVYVCSATYEENVVIHGTGARIFGGFACEAGWGRTARPAEFAPPEGIPLTIRHASAPVRIDSLSFVAPAGTQPSQSSIAAVVVDASDVVLEHVELRAGDGAAGADGAKGEEFASAAGNGAAGKNAPVSTCKDGSGKVLAECLDIVQPWKCGGTCKPVLCDTDNGKQIAVYRLHGGAGGNGYKGAGVQPEPGNTLSSQVSPAPGAQSNPGMDGADGKPGASGIGEITGDGEYLANNVGADGKFGRLGIHGAGGGGGPAWQPGDLFLPLLSGSGGSGGFPGCGGRPGRGGGAGGASIALISVNSNIALDHVHLRTSAGGVGGAGALGGGGQQGGEGGKGGKSQGGVINSQSGQAGGPGGRGGDSGPGAGGPSIGIVSIGAEPTRTATIFDTGIGGKGGPPAQGSSVGRGANGLSEDKYTVESAAEK